VAVSAQLGDEGQTACRVAARNDAGDVHDEPRKVGMSR
jgi:hypothetical protein